MESLSEKFNCLTPENIKLFYEFFKECVTFDDKRDITKETFYSNVNRQKKLIPPEPAPEPVPEPAPAPVQARKNTSYFPGFFKPLKN